MTLWTFPDIGASVALDMTQWRETQHGQPGVEHFTHSPQKLQTGKHLTKQVWSRLLEERKGPAGLILCFPCTPHICPFAVHLLLGCVPGYSMS